MEHLMKGARTVVATCLGIKPNEKILVVTDTKMKRFGEAIYETALKISKKTEMIVIKPTGSHGAEPPKRVARMMKKSDVVIAPTYFSLTHTKARREACKSGARVATMPQVSEFSFVRGGLTADYKKVEKLSEKMHDAVENARMLRVVASNGTDVSFSVEGREWDKDTGLYRKAGQYGNLPAGETETAPIEGTANGKVVFEHFGEFGKNVKLVVKNGYVLGSNSEKLERVFKKLGTKVRNIAEIGIGTNPKAKLIGNVLEDEKIFGTVHIALGNNKSYGGNVDIPFHEDGIIAKPTLIADGKIIIKNGKWMI